MANLRQLIIIVILFSLISVNFIANIGQPSASTPPDTEPSNTPTTRSRLDTWNMFSHDLQHTSNTTTTAPLTDNILWTNTTGAASESYSSPIIAYGKIFVGTGSSYFYCFDENTGELLWSNYYQKVSWGTCGSATAVDGYVYIGAEDNYIYCLDPTDGSEVWKQQTGGPVWSCPAVYGGRLFVGSADRYLYCYDQFTGEPLWKYETNHSTYGYQDYGISSSPAISNGKVFIAACDGNLTALPLSDPNSNGLINSTEKYWEFDTGCYIYASPTVHNGKVYIGTGSYSKLAGAPPIYKIFCLDENTGAKLWEYTAGSYILGTPAVGYDKLYIGALDGKLYCLPLVDPNDNGVISESEVIWKFNTPNELWGSAVLAEGRVYFASGIPYWSSGNGDYRVYCLPTNDPNNNGVISSDEIIWSYQIDAGVLCTPAILDGRLYVCDYEGKVFCFGKDTIPPRIKSILPQEDANDVATDTDIFVEFTENIAAGTLSPSNFTVEAEDSSLVSGVITYDDILFTAKFDPDADLEEATTYTVTLNSGIKDANGNGLDCNGNGLVDPGEEYSWSFSTAVYPPSISAIPTQRPVEGEDWFLDMSLYVTDPNTLFENLIITENSSYAVVQNEFIILNYPNGISTELVNVTVSDGVSTVWRDVVVEVKATNDAPVISSIPDIQAVEDIDKIVDFAGYMIDIDNTPEELTVTENSTYCTVNGLVLTFNYPNGIITEIVNLTVDDGNKKGHRHFKVIVTPVNDAPIIDEIPDQTAVEDIELVFNITKYVTDIDNTISELELTTNSGYASVESSANTLALTFNYPEGILGEVVNITVSDSDKDADRSFNMTVKPVNDPPTLSEIPVQYAVEDIDYQLDLQEYVDDIDTALEDLNVFVNSQYLISSNGLVLTFNFPNGVTEKLVNLSIKDGAHKIYADVEFIITPVNDRPQLTKGTLEPASGNTNTVFTFTVKYKDIDGDADPTVEVVIDSKLYEMEPDAQVNNPLIGIEYSVDLKLSKGTHDYYFQCDDNSGAPNSTSSTDSASVKVSAKATSGAADSAVVIGIVAVIIIVIIVVIIILFLFLKKRQKGEAPPPPPAMLPPIGPPETFRSPLEHDRYPETAQSPEQRLMEKRYRAQRPSLMPEPHGHDPDQASAPEVDLDQDLEAEKEY